jgi:hypothetical protein
VIQSILGVLLAPVKRLKPREWLIILAGLLIGLIVSAMFKTMVMRERPVPSERPSGPLSTVDSPGAFSKNPRFVYHDPYLDLSALSIRTIKDQTNVEIRIAFHLPKDTPGLEIGSYEPPNFVDADGQMVLGTFNPPTNRPFRNGETLQSIIAFSGKPRRLPLTVTLFLGERYGGRFHLKPVVLTGLSPDLESPVPQHH